MIIKIKIVLLAFLAASLCQAGAISTRNVEIDDTQQTARGTFTAVRESNDNTQFIWCMRYAITGAEIMMCSATDANGTNRMCQSSDPALLAAVSSLSAKSYVRFEWDNSGQCTLVAAMNGSPY